MALLTPVQITRAGVVSTLAACSGGGDTYLNTNKPELEFNNGSGADITVYAAIYADGQTIVQGRSWVIAAGTRKRIAPMTSPYENPADRKCSLTYSGVTSLSLGLFYR
jgi:hypothetical protein